MCTQCRSIDDNNNQAINKYFFILFSDFTITSYVPSKFLITNIFNVTKINIFAFNIKVCDI